MADLTDVMVDLETMGTEPGCPIVAIGAVLFNPKTDEIGDTFYSLIELESCIDAGMKVCADTIKWWFRQSDAVRGQVCNPSLDRVDLRTALIDFSVWLPSDKCRIWGNGSDFDNVILEAAYKMNGMNAPWPFWNNRCYRTIKNLKPSIELVRQGTHHNALDDAISQAKHMQMILGNRK